MALTWLKLSGPRAVVVPWDPALDRDAAGFADAWTEYERTRDPSKLPVVVGGELTVFLVGSLTVEQSKHCQSQPDIGRIIFEKLAYGVHEILGLRAEDEHGAPVSFAAQRRDTPIGKRLDDATLALFTDEMLALYVAAAVTEASSLAKDQTKSRRDAVVGVRPSDG